MNEFKKSLRRTGCITGLVVMAHLVVFQLLSGILMVVMIMALDILGLMQLEAAILYIASDAAMLISGVIYLVFYLINRKAISESSPQKGKIKLASIIKCIIIILGVNAFLSAVNTIFSAVTGLSLTIPSVSAEGTNPWLLLVTVAVFPAVVEELIFRGVIYRYLRQHGTVFAAISSSLIFGLIHLNILQFLFAFAMGLVLCHIYERSGKLRYAMLLHFINNSIMVLANVLPVEAGIIIIIECIAGIIAFVCGAVYLVIGKRRQGWILYSNSESSGLWRKCRYFFTSVPMLLLVLLCVTICVFVMFI